jgi:hypothetical protein
MKKQYFFLAVSVLTSLSLFSQNLRFGIKGGLNLANEKIKTTNTARKANTIGSFHAGFIADILLTDALYVQPQLLLTGKGSQDGSFFYRPYYVELPVNLVYKLPVTDDIKIYGGLGPGIAMGVFGNVKNADLNFQKDLRFGEVNNADYKTVDLTGGFELGAEFNNKLGLGIGYRWSFLDVTPGSAKVTHKVVNFSVAYFLGGLGRKSAKKNSSRRVTRKR